MSGIGAHQSYNMMKDEWLTPPEIIRSLGEFDLDPCSPIERPWKTARHHFTVLDDGLNQEWKGRIWCNPPYGRETVKWLRKLADHGNGIALIFARTETRMFFETVWLKASAVLFIEGRLHFYHRDGSRASGNSGAPSVLVAYGEANKDALKASGINGKLIELEN